MRHFSIGYLPRSTCRVSSNVIFYLNLQKFFFIMPKNYSHHAALKEQRIALKDKSGKYAPGNVKLNVLGSGSKGMPSSLYLFSDHRSYLFNCGEGTQRLANEHRRRLSKLDNIFITHPSWRNIGGLPGLALTVQDVGLPNLALHGPDELEEILPATKRFVILNHLSIEKVECSPTQDFEDNVLTVKYVPLVADSSELNQKLSSRQTDPSLLIEDDTDYYWHERKPQNRRGSSNSSEEGSALKRKDVSQPSSQEPKRRKECIPGSTSMAYLCQLKPRPGALLITRCVELNVPVGPLLGQLKAGNDITLADGTVVKATDVREPDDPGPVFIILECPTTSFIDALINEKTFEKHQLGGKEDDLAFVVVHFSPPEVMKDPRYESWMKKFSPTTNHLIMNESNECSGSIAIHQIQHQLNLLDPSVFPLLNDSSIPVESAEMAEKNDSSCNSDVSTKNSSPVKKPQRGKNLDRKQNSTNGTNLNDIDSRQVTGSSEKVSERGQVIHGRTMLNVDLRPSKTIQSDSCLVLKPNEYIEEVLKVEGLTSAMNDLHGQLENLPLDSNDYPKVIFFGTGSSVPNKARNTSGILLQTSADSYVIMDCGEGTYGQMVRFFGPEESDRVLSKVHAIYISHLHADHHIGLIGLLQARRKVIAAEDFTPVYLLAPFQIMTWLQKYSRDFEPIDDTFKIIYNSNFSQENECPPSDEAVGLLNVLNLTQIQTTKVRHCANAFGISFSHSAGWKLTYSGDTMPCEELVKIGMDSDLLIHEATMEDNLLDEAELKLHSTTSQAIGIGRSMKAKFTLLTHFSQRYAKLPNLSQNYDTVGIAFDNMQVRMGDLKKLPLMIPALQVMFTEHCEEMKLKAEKRQRKQDLLKRQIKEEKGNP